MQIAHMLGDNWRPRSRQQLLQLHTDFLDEKGVSSVAGSRVFPKTLLEPADDPRHPRIIVAIRLNHCPLMHEL